MLFRMLMGVGCTPSLPICFSARSRMSSMMFTRMRTMTLVPHEPRWLPTGCSGKSFVVIVTFPIIQA
jgi:hypothetical protein